MCSGSNSSSHSWDARLSLLDRAVYLDEVSEHLWAVSPNESVDPLTPPQNTGLLQADDLTSTFKIIFFSNATQHQAKSCGFQTEEKQVLSELKNVLRKAWLFLKLGSSLS